MSLHDDFIKKAYKEIDKLTVDIEKKKSRMKNVSLLIISQKRNNPKHRRQKIRQKSLSLKYLTILFLTVIQITQQQPFLKIPSIRISRQTDF